MESLLRRATAGDTDAQYELAELYIDGRNGVAQDHKQGIEWANKAAAQQHAKAAFLLGTAHCDSLYGLVQDDRKAIEFYEIATKQNFAGAMTNLGWMHSHGRGVVRDTEKAREYYRKAAQLGDTRAMYNLGIRYCEAGNYATALVWYQRAAKAGKEDAEPEINEILRCHLDDIVLQLANTEAIQEELRVAKAQIEHLRACPHPDFDSAMRDFETAQRNGLV